MTKKIQDKPKLRVIPSEQKPKFLTAVEPPSPVGRKAGTGPTQRAILQVFEVAESHGRAFLWPHQIWAGARELCGYQASKDVLKESLKKLVEVELVVFDEDEGYRRAEKR